MLDQKRVSNYNMYVAKNFTSSLGRRFIMRRCEEIKEGVLHINILKESEKTIGLFDEQRDYEVTKEFLEDQYEKVENNSL